MGCNVITRNGYHYISYDGLPYIWCGPDEPTICTTGDILTDYCISFLDEAHPHYVIGTGNVGSLWGPDVYYYYSEMATLDPAFPSCGHILFDVDTARVAKSGLESDPFFVYPTGVNSSNLTGCYMPTPAINVIRIDRPSGVSVGTISQEQFADRVLSGIIDIWGTGFYDRMSAVSGTHKLWIIRENGDSLRLSVIQSGIDIVKDTLIASGIEVSEHISSCSDNERYLGWVVDCIKYSGDNVSCTGMDQIPNVIQNECYCSGSEPNTNKLTTVTIQGYGSGIDEYLEGDPPWTVVEIATPYDNFTDCDNIVWPQNNYLGYYQVWVTGGIGAYVQTELTYSFFYEGGIPKVSVTSVCGNIINNEYRTRTFSFSGEIPLDQYGLPNGAVIFEDFVDLDEGGYATSDCSPLTPDIVFFSHPPTSQLVCLPIISGSQDCESINP